MSATAAFLDTVFEEFAPPGPTPFDGFSDGDRLRITLASGEALSVTYMPMIGQHYVRIDEPGKSRVEGPYRSGEVVSATLERTGAEILQERRERARGALVPGRLYRTRDGYESRLELLAGQAARATSRRRMEIEHQFDDVADEIALAKTKRRWMLAVARWARFSNEPPTKLDLSNGDMTMAEKFQRPRPQDFDPDPKVRRARAPLPAHVRNDPISTRNMIKALRAAGFKARASVLGEVTDDIADLLVDFPGGKQNGRFSVDGRRRPDGTMVWRLYWDGNGTKADQTRQRRCRNRADYPTFLNIVARGTAAFDQKIRSTKTDALDSRIGCD